MNIIFFKIKIIEKKFVRFFEQYNSVFLYKELGIIIFLIFFLTPCLAQFDFEQFRISDLADLQLVNNATLEGNKIRLTLNAGNQVGACWYKTKQQVDKGFESEFSFQITDIGGWGGGDGFAFLIQNYAVDALGGTGGAIGYGGIPNSLAIEFDTWKNYGDPNDNHISVQTRGTGPNDNDQSASIGYTTDIPNLSDGEIHRVKITYKPPKIEIYMDSLNSMPILSVNINLVDSLQLDDGRAWIGFTTSTGSAYEKHYILSWKFIPANSVGIDFKEPKFLAKNHILEQNYPNPFNPTTTIRYALPKAGNVTLTVYNLLGQKVCTLVSTHQLAGQYQVQWNGRDDKGKKMPSGVYLYRLKTEGFNQILKMILMK